MNKSRIFTFSRWSAVITAVACLMLAAMAVGCGSDDVSDEEEYSIGGTVSGLQEGGLVLQNHGVDDLEIDEDGPFTFDTTLGDGVEYDVSIAVTPPEHTCELSNAHGFIDGEDVTDVEVECEGPEEEEPAPRYSVSIDAPASTLSGEPGDILTLVAEIENTGDAQGAQDIELESSGTVEDMDPAVQLEPGETHTVELDWDTTGADVGTYTAWVRSDDASESASLTVFEYQPFFEVNVDGGESNMEDVEGEDIVLTGEVTNTGDETGTQQLDFVIDDDVLETTEEIELEPDESEPFEFVWETEIGDAGTYTGEVRSDDDASGGTVTVNELPQPHFAVSIDEGESELDVEEGETVFVEAEIENTGDKEGVQDIGLEIDGNLVDVDTDIELDPGEDETVELQWDAGPGSEGTYTADVISFDAFDSTEVTVELPTDRALFAVFIDDEASELIVDEGETVVIEVEIENRGDVADTQDIIFEFDGDEEEVHADLELDGGESGDPGESEVLTFELETEDGDFGLYTAEILSDDHADDATVGIIDPEADASVSGVVADAALDPHDMEGVEVVLFDSETDDEVARTTVEAEGNYEISEVDSGVYELRLEAPGLEPNYGLVEADGDNFIFLILPGGDEIQDVTVDWLRETDLYIDGGVLDFDDDDPDGDFAVELPGCEQQPDGSWEPEEIEEEDVDVTLDPEGECFQINDVGIDLLTGELDVETGNILFPDVTVYIDDSDDQIDPMVDGIEVDFDWYFDDIAGEVDFTDGSMDLDIDVRILVGGTAESMMMDAHFGAREGYDDCQLTSAWGGDVTDPTEDENDEQIGDYLHDPIELRTTTGESGPSNVTGEPYDAEEGFFVSVDNQAVIGRLSEGSIAGGDPGGPSCGELDFMGFFEEDYAALFNDMMELPTDPGQVYGEFNFLIPPQ